MEWPHIFYDDGNFLNGQAHQIYSDEAFWNLIEKKLGRDASIYILDKIDRAYCEGFENGYANSSSGLREEPDAFGDRR